jgi:glycerol-3-phosphate acyltransferase PlsY
MSPLLHMETISFATAGLAYLLGSIPFGLILTRMAGLGDIRQLGSGNIGATNVLRTGRKGLAAGTLLLDAAKGALAVQLAGVIFGAIWMPLAAMAAVLGHCFPIWLRLRGGKGVATGLGVLIALDWRIGVAACAIWLLVFIATRISSASALSAFAVAPILAWLLLPRFWFIAPLVIASIVWARHTPNIRRLLAGTEPRVGRKNREPA